MKCHLTLNESRSYCSRRQKSSLAFNSMPWFIDIEKINWKWNLLWRLSKSRILSSSYSGFRLKSETWSFSALIWNTTVNLLLLPKACLLMILKVYWEIKSTPLIAKGMAIYNVYLKSQEPKALSKTFRQHGNLFTTHTFAKGWALILRIRLYQFYCTIRQSRHNEI